MELLKEIRQGLIAQLRQTDDYVLQGEIKLRIDVLEEEMFLISK